MDAWAQRKTLKHQPAHNPLKTTFFLLKISFLALGFVSFIHFGVPSLHHFIFHTIPALWLSLTSWLSFTPFLYIILNCIILTIAATSSLHYKPKAEDDSTSHKEQHLPSVPPPEISYHDHHQDQHDNLYQEAPISYSLVPVETHFLSATVHNVDEDGSFSDRSTWSPTPKQRSLPEISLSSCKTSVEDKPLASARFTHKKSSKASPDTKSSPLRIARPKKGETLEYTWKTITEGRHPPLARHLRKSETWDNTPKVASAELSLSPGRRSLRKSQTVRQRGVEDSPVSSASASPARHSMKREPSLSQDELNKRVEAFISKFNNEIRLQRQNSFKSYMDMINRSSQ